MGKVKQESGAGRHTRRNANEEAPAREGRNGAPQGRGRGNDAQGRGKGKGAEEERRRPDLRVVAKVGDGSHDDDFFPVGAFWQDSETGYLQGGVDARVRRITIELKDGRECTLEPGTPGEFLNAYDSRV